MNRPIPINFDREALGQVVLVLQGGGALGAYQAGVYEALHEAGIEPDWVIGTSIGAINAGIIAGNAPENRLARLRSFWDRVQPAGPAAFWAGLPHIGATLANAAIVAGGVPGFFKPNPVAAMGGALSPETAGYYSVEPLAATLAELIDVDLLNECRTRLTVGAANVRTAEMKYFDSRDMPVGIRHIMASGALPPAFPAVRIDGDLYWDGGIMSNTPVEAVFDDHPRQSGLVLSVHIWHPHGPEPGNMASVLTRQKDIQYSSRSMAQVVRQRQIHRMRHVIAELAAKLPPELRDTPEARELASYGCLTRMHVVRLVAPPRAGEDHTKDIDFSREGIAERWAAGYAHTAAVLKAQPWTAPHDPLEGFILHETDMDQRIGG